MKYCPNCGNKLDGARECSCGFEMDEDYELDEDSENVGPFATGMMILDDSELFEKYKEYQESLKKDKENK